jgi:tol-pal system protein YbgF
MNKIRFGLVAVLFALLVYGCASRQTEITRQDLADAQATINSAKLLGAQEVALEEIALAEHYYKLALDDYNQAPKGRLGAFLREKRALEASASDNARLAKSQAEIALLKIKSQGNTNAALQTEAAELQSQVTRLEREKEMYRQEQAALMTELQREKDRLLQEKASASVPAPALDNRSQTACTTTSEDLYNKAFYLFQTRHYDQARATFERHRQLYSDNLSDNAQFWIAECYYMQRTYDSALRAFQAVLTDFPQSNKAADTLLSMGLCRNRLNQRDAAVQDWQAVVTQYPGSTAAAHARDFLDKP